MDLTVWCKDKGSWTGRKKCIWFWLNSRFDKFVGLGKRKPKSKIPLKLSLLLFWQEITSLVRFWFIVFSEARFCSFYRLSVWWRHTGLRWRLQTAGNPVATQSKVRSNSSDKAAKRKVKYLRRVLLLLVLIFILLRWKKKLPEYIAEVKVHRRKVEHYLLFVYSLQK